MKQKEEVVALDLPDLPDLTVVTVDWVRECEHWVRLETIKGDLIVEFNYCPLCGDKLID